MSIRLSLLLALLSILSTVCAASSSTIASATADFTAAATASTALVAPTLAASSAAVGAGSHGYTYLGCYNETTGYSKDGDARALGGNTESGTYMTTADCLDFCTASGYQYCGLEYGRECWISPTIDPLSTRLNDSACDFACEGNSSEICGGALALTVYNLTDSLTSSSSAAADRLVGWRRGALGAVTLLSGLMVAL